MRNRILVLALLFIILLSIGVFGIRIFEREDLRPGFVYRVELNQSNLALTHDYFSVNKALPWVKLTMQRITEASAPSNISNAYAYFRIAPEGMTNYELKNAELEFRVSNKWFEDYDHNESLIVLNVFDEYGGVWHELPTEYTGYINGHAYYKTNTENFGYFAITAKPKPVEEEPEFIDVVEEEPGIIMPAPRKTLEERLKEIPTYIYLILINIVVISLLIPIVYSAIFKIMHPYPELTKYVRSSIRKGGEIDEIKKVLIGAGWPRDIVRKELDAYKERAIPEHMVSTEQEAPTEEEEVLKK
ncbi:PGF-pre-PGF domain-containing protein [Candidatus Woesearchaeota archaeon]|nr:PGF-pre-PGF domain-containing protein [Candidatus Woesearchaeota archaeon]